MIETWIVSTLFPSVIFTFGLAIEAIKELGGVSNDFSNRIQWVDDEKIKGLCQFFTKTLNLYHTFFLYISLELTFLDKTMLLLMRETNAQVLSLKLTWTPLWGTLEVDRRIPRHKGELSHCSIGEHMLDTQGLCPCCRTLSKSSY